MRRFKPAQRLPHDWATRALKLRKYQHATHNPEKSEYGQQALEQLTYLLDHFGDELRDAIAIVSSAQGEVNTTRSQQIAQYHRNRIGKLERTINEIDHQLNEPTDHGTLKVAELTSKRQDLEYQLKDHGDKIDRRSHGLHLTKMRRKHR